MDSSQSPLEKLHRPAFDAVGDWVSRFEIDGAAVGGQAKLDQDSRFSAWLGSGVELEGKRIVELGPLEGGHTKLLCRGKAASVVAIEGFAENFVKCCVVKNVFSLDQATFVLDRIENVTRETYGEFDIGLACGVLYHLTDPAEVLARLAELCPVVMVWTHIATEWYPGGPEVELESRGRVYRGRWYEEPPSNLSGLDERSFWPYLEDLRRMFFDSGFGYVDELAVDWEHPQGADWLGTLWRDRSSKPADSLWRDASLLPAEAPPAPRPAPPLTRLARALLPAGVRRSIRRRLGR